MDTPNLPENDYARPSLTAIIPSLSIPLIVGLSFLTLVSYTIVLSVYRLYFHPLAKAGFPGPSLAACSYWYEFWYDVLADGGEGGEMMNKLEELHNEYGPIVRVTPDELHINDPHMFDTIYAPSSKPRDKDPRFCKSVAAPYATIMTSDHTLHRKRRSALNHFFSKQSVLRREHEIKQKLLQLCHRLDAELAAGKSVHRADVFYHAFTTDVITEFAFGHPLGLLDRPDFGVEMKDAMVNGAKAAALFKAFPWLIHPMSAIPAWFMELIGSQMAGMVRLQESAFKQTKQLVEKNRLGLREENTIFQTILDSDVRPAAEKQAICLSDEALSVTGAGSETTAKTLTFLTFGALEDKTILSKLRDELKAVPKDSDGLRSLCDLEKLPYLTACIREALRMTLGITARSGRIAYEEIKYREWTIPAGTSVSMLNSVCNWNPTLFPDPHRYDPDRWIRAAERGENLERWLISFSKGSRMCVGVNLAYAELYLVAAHILSRYETMNIDTTWEDDLKIVKDWFVGGARPGSKGVKIKLYKQC